MRMSLYAAVMLSVLVLQAEISPPGVDAQLS